MIRFLTTSIQQAMTAFVVTIGSFVCLWRDSNIEEMGKGELIPSWLAWSLFIGIMIGGWGMLFRGWV